MQHRIHTIAGALACVLLLAAGWVAPPAARAVSFRPDVLESLRTQGALPAAVAGIQAAQARGLDRPPATARGWLQKPDGQRSIPDRNAIVILVDFSDKPANLSLYPPAHYTDMLFSVGTYPTGSMRDWYLENSYGAFNVTGQVTVWLRMPQTYAYYVDGQAGFGGYPQNAQRLAEDAVNAANSSVDFSQFDNDGPDGIPNSGDDDGVVDAIFVVHAGPGRETTGSDNDIHSHAWSMVNAPAVDGVTAYGYCMEPDDGKRGVFGHEFGHVLGLPDLYDTDYSSSGVGDWCMMSFGSWGGGGLTPTHFLSWCKSKLDFLDPVSPLANQNGASLPQVETSPTAFALWTGGYPDRQYFTVENRQRVGSDVSLPGSGLVICHIDENQDGNTNEAHPLVAIEQADGLNELAAGGASDTGDPWPGSANNRNFTDTSIPNARDYENQPTQVGVRNISNSITIMTADLQVETRPILVLQNYAVVEQNGNGDGNIDPGEQFQIQLTLFNRGAPATNVSGTLTTAEPGVSIQQATSSFGTMGAESPATGTPPFLASLSSASTTDGIPFLVALQSQSGFLGSVPVAVGVNDVLESFRWNHDSISFGYGDQWHITTQRNHTAGGRYSWLCGVDGGSYANLLDAGLVTRSIPLATVDAVRFWHWIDAEDDANQTAWDGGIVEASVDGGPFIQITPDGGYPYTIIQNAASPFAPGTPCFSGTFGWAQVRFDLTGLSGTEVRLRFRFGSDGYVTGEGWYIDDVVVEGTIASDVAQETPSAAPAGLFLAPPVPNPAQGAVGVQFIQPAGRGVRLSLIDAAGRLISEWSYPAASADRATQRELRWGGRGSNGRAVPSGVYFFHLEGGEAAQSRRLLWIR